MLQAKVLLLPTKKLARTTFYILSGKQEFSVYIKRSELKIDVAKNASFNSLSNHAMAKKRDYYISPVLVANSIPHCQ